MSPIPGKVGASQTKVLGGLQAVSIPKASMPGESSRACASFSTVRSIVRLGCSKLDARIRFWHRSLRLWRERGPTCVYNGGSPQHGLDRLYDSGHAPEGDGDVLAA